MLRNCRAAPSRTDIHRRLQANLDGKLLENLQVCSPIRASRYPLMPLLEGHFPGRTRVHVLVFDLDADHRASILEEKTLYLLRDPGKIAPDIGEIPFIVG